MELNHDWRGFIAIFQPRRRQIVKTLGGASTRGPIYVITDGATVLAAQSAEGEDFSSFCGQWIEHFTTAQAGRELAVMDRRHADSKLTECLGLSNNYEQSEFLRASQGLPATQSHFLLSGLQSWWAKVLPSSYGFFIRLDGRVEGGGGRELFVLVRRGKLALFHAPDLSSLSLDRLRDMVAVVKYLSEKHAVPVQGLSVSAADWAEWSELRAESSVNPWKKLAFALQSNDAQLVPFRWQVMTLVATRAFFRI
jgi:hypothetical protein